MLYRPEWSGLKRLLFAHAAAKKTETAYYTDIVIGTISGSTGQNESGTPSANRARTADYIPVSKFESLIIPNDTQYSYFCFLYKSDKSTFVRIPSAWSNGTVTGETLLADYPEYEFIRVIFRVDSSNSNVTDEDLDRFKTLITVKE